MRFKTGQVYRSLRALGMWTFAFDDEGKLQLGSRRDIGENSVMTCVRAGRLNGDDRFWLVLVIHGALLTGWMPHLEDWESLIELICDA